MTHFFHAATLAALAFLIIETTLLGRHLMATQADVDKLTAQVVKIGDEVKAAHAVLVSELADLKAQLAAAGTAEKVDLTGLAAAIQNVDDIHADPAPEPEPVVDEPVTEPVIVEETVVEDSPPAE